MMLVGGALFAGVGSLFTVVGIFMFFNLDSMHIEGNLPPIMMPIIFTGLGLIAAVVGFIMLHGELCRRRQSKALIAAGIFVWATIDEIFEDYSVTVNGMPGLCIGLSWKDPDSGVVYKFASEPTFKPLPNYPEGYQLKVYVDPDSGYTAYHVALKESRAPRRR